MVLRDHAHLAHIEVYRVLKAHVEAKKNRPAEFLCFHLNKNLGKKRHKSVA